MPLIRSIGRWILTALVVNSIVGASIFGLHSELTRLLGRASPIAMLVAAMIVSTLLWQPYLPHQLSKPWVGAYRVECEVSLHTD